MESKIIRPEPNKPITALVVESRSVESKFGGQQILVTLQGGKMIYLPASAARDICAGHTYTICKKQIKEGMRATWKVEPAEPEPFVPHAPRPGDTRLRVEPAFDDGEYEPPPAQRTRIPRDSGGRTINFPPAPTPSELEERLKASVEATERAKAEAAAKVAGSHQQSRLAAALCAAVDAAAIASKHAKEKHGMDVVFDAEMIKCLGVTAYIQNARSTQ